MSPYFASVGGLLFLSAGFAAASEPIPGIDSPNPHVQLPSFMAPANTPGGDCIRVPATLVFQLPENGDVRAFCQMSPRVRDAVMQEIHERPFRLSADGKVVPEDVNLRLAAAVNRSLQEGAVLKVFVFNRVLPSGSGGAKFAKWLMCRDTRR